MNIYIKRKRRENVNIYEFQILTALKRNGACSQRTLQRMTDISLGKVNSCVRSLTERGYLVEGQLTALAEQALEPYKVDNAVIMAAGMSSRFAPLSYEKPKGLMLVKGEILIERQIRQLHEAGITDITVVVGYMKEKFFYLQKKFGVKIVVNEDYYRYNNTSTLIRVVDELKNTYVCSSDNYFVDNVFEPYVYQAYYSAVYFPGKCNEDGIICDRRGKIIGIQREPVDMWCMLGHVYFSRAFSQAFREVLLEQYDSMETRTNLWERLYERNLDRLTMYIRRYDADKVLEFDSLEDLRGFDDKYLENTDSKIFKNICKVLDCKESEIGDIQVLKDGLTNLSFHFRCKGGEYVYRHPGVGTEAYISRRSEAFSMEVASRLGLDRTFIYANPEEGWKISHFIRNARCMDYHNSQEVRQALELVRKLHTAAIHSDYEVDIWQKTLDLIEKIRAERKDFADFDELFQAIERLYQITRADGVEKVLCHYDCYSPNFLIGEDGEMTLIDWEYSGNDDPAIDLSTFICCSDYNYEQALEVLDIYYGRKPTVEELRHNLAYVAITSYYWFIWAIYQESVGNTVGRYLLLWYQSTKVYMKKAQALYKMNEGEEVNV